MRRDFGTISEKALLNGESTSDVIEAAVFHNIRLPVDLPSSEIFLTSEKGLQKCVIEKNGHAKCLTVFKLTYPEEIVACKQLIENKLVVVSSRNRVLLGSIDGSKFIEEMAVECAHSATSISSLILGPTWETLTVLLGSVEGELVHWRPSRDRKPSKLAGHRGMVFAIASDSERIFSVSDDRTIRMWSINGNEEPSKTEIAHAYGHAARPFALCVDEASRTLFTGGIEQTIFVWKYTNDTIKLERKLSLSIGVIRKITLVARNQLMVSSHDGYLVMVRVPSQQSAVEISEDKHNFTFVGNSLVTISTDDVLSVYGKDLPAKIVFRAQNVRHLAASSGGTAVAWNGNILFVIRKNRVSRVVMSSNIIVAIPNTHHFMVKLVDGLVRFYELGENESSEVSYVGSCTLPKSSVIPQTFATINRKFEGRQLVVIGTSHGELLHVLFSRNDVISVASNSLERKIEKEMFNGKEITNIELTSKDDVTLLGKSGTCSTVRYELSESGDVKTILLNTQHLPASHGVSWPCRFLRTNNSLHLLGFYGTTMIILDTKTGIPVCEVMCGGGHRMWHVSHSEDSSEAQFYFLRDGIINKHLIDLDGVKVVRRSQHASAVVAVASSSRQSVATVALDGSLTISTGYEAHSYDFELLRSLVAGDNLLCVDIYETDGVTYVVTGGGKSRASFWRIDDDVDENDNSFWLRHMFQSTEGRIVCVRVVRFASKVLFFLSFSSAVIEIITIKDNELTSLAAIRLPSHVGMGSRVDFARTDNDHQRFFVGTSGSYLLSYDLDVNIQPTLRNNMKLNDRSGVTAMRVFKDDDVVVGFDSGNVSVVSKDESTRTATTHLSCVVGVDVRNEHGSCSIYSVSLDCVLHKTCWKENLDERSTSKHVSTVNMPSGLTCTRDCVIVVGDRVETFIL